MMKKAIALILLCAFCFSFVACGKPKEDHSAKYFYDGIEDLSRYIELPDYSSLTLDFAPEATEEEVESYLKNLVSQNPGMNKITDRPIAQNDTVAITFVGSLNGEKDANCSYENTDTLYECTVGAGRHIPGFEEGLIGVTPGDSVTLNLTFPETYGNADYAGKDVTFEIKTYEIREYYTPELNDEFVKGLALTDNGSAVETVDALRVYAKNKVEKSNRDQIMQNADYYKWQMVIETAEVKEYPQEQIDIYVNQEFENHQKTAAQYGMEFSDYLAYYKTTEDGLKELLAEQAKSYIRNCFVAEKIFRDENLSFTEEEYKEMLEDLALDQKAESGQALIDQYGDDFMRLYFVSEKAMAHVAGVVKDVNRPAENTAE